MQTNLVTRTTLNYAFVCALGSLMMLGCDGQNKAPQGMPAMPPLPVATYKVVTNDIPVSLE